MIGLVLGSLDLMDPEGSPFAVETLAEGTDWGNPQPVEVAVRSLLQDGSIVSHERDDNREVSLRIIVSAPDSAALAEGESALMAELYRANTLTYTPADGWGPPTVFVVVTSSLAHTMDDLGEVRGQRTWTVRLVCSPFGRSQTEVEIEALPTSGTTTTLVNNGSATTNWTAAVDGVAATPSVVSGAVTVSTVAASARVTLALIYTASITTSATNLLQVDWKPETPNGDPNLRAYGDGIELTLVGQAQSPTAGYTRTWFVVAAASIAVLRLESTSQPPTSPPTPGDTRSLSVDNINRTDVPPTIGTARQLLRSMDIGGSARTRVALAVEHLTSSLGHVLLYCFPDVKNVAGYSPPLQQYWVSGGTVTSDSARISGTRQNLVGATATFDIPYQRVAVGAHTLIAHLLSEATPSPVGEAVTVSWTATTRVNGVTVGPTISGSRSFVLPSDAYTIQSLGRMSLPTVDVDPSATTAVVRVTLTATSAASGVRFDEGWLFNTTIGQLLGPVPCETGTASSGGPARRLFYEPPSVDVPRSTIRIGHAANRSDAFYPAALGGWQLLEFPSGRINLLSVTSNALGAAISGRYYKAWHTHAGD